MKCLSLWQPWATLIVIGAKRIETRSWETSYKGPLLIHAAKKWNRELSEMTYEDGPFRDALVSSGFNHQGQKAGGLPLGCIVGVCDLVACWPTEDLGVITHAGARVITDQERDFGDYSEGRFAWLLTNIRRFVKPLPCVGHQGIFNVDDWFVGEQLAKAVKV